MTSRTAGRSPISGAQLGLAIAGIVLATAVLPPAAAWWLNARRIAETDRRADAAAMGLRERADGSGTAFVDGSGVVCGPGRLPDIAPSAGATAASPPGRATHEAWILSAVMKPELFGEGMPTDAWGRCFLMNAGAEPGQPLWILSAGPNGVVETPRAATAIGGDDIGRRVR